MKKLFALILAFSLVASVSLALAQEPVTLSVTAIWAEESEANRLPYLKTLEEFQQAYPWIHLEAQQKETNQWQDEGLVLAEQDQLPDVFYWNAGGFLKPLVDAGDVMPLNSFLTDELMIRIEGGTLIDMTFDGKIYQLPYTRACSVMYCNTELFTQHNIQIPETWQELLDAIEAFKAVGVTPMTVGGKDSWPTNMYADLLALRFAGDTACRAAYYKHEDGTFLSKGMQDAMAALEQLVKMGAFPENAAEMTRVESEQLFFDGQIPMYVHGQWFAGSLSPEMQQKVKAIPFPAVGRGYDNQFMGGAAEGFCVSSRTQHPEEAFLLCQFLAQGLSRNGYIYGAGLPAWMDDFSSYSDLNPVLMQIVDATASAESFLLWGNTALTGDDSALLESTINQLLAGQLDAEGACQQLEAIFD